MLLRTAFLVALLATIAAPAAPAAATESPATQRSIQIACQAFPAACAVQTPRIVWDASLTARGHEGEATGRQWVDGAWQTVAWVVAIMPGMTPARECDVLVHEFGHLAGVDEHTAEGVMSAGGGEWPACHPPPTRRAHAISVIRLSLPGYHTWRVNCDRAVSRCVARSATARRARYFEVDPLGSVDAGAAPRARVRTRR